MSLRARGLLVAAVHMALVVSLAGKLYWDRARLPRVWARAEPSDRKQPIRGRYLRLQLKVDLAPGEWKTGATLPARLSVRDNRLVADSAPARGAQLWLRVAPDGRTGVLVQPLLALFIPEGDAHWARREGEIQVEVTVPEAGPPRPIRLGAPPPGSRDQTKSEPAPR